jgi:hypothetical protein
VFTYACSSSKEAHLNASIISSIHLIHLTQGDDIAVKGCSVQHVVNILRVFGVEICKGETISERKQRKNVSVDGSESNKTVVQGMFMVFGVYVFVLYPI